jgi:2-dehydropantoate 2-reductase
MTPAAKLLSQAGFMIELTESPGQIIWEKVAVNAGINPITALLNIPNGAILKIPEARQLMRDLVVEAVKVASTEGYRFEHSVVEVAERTCQDTAENISSMLQDIRAGKQTENDAISGEIVRRAQLSALPTPRTRVIWQLVRGLERR